MVDASDLSPDLQQWGCEFESRPEYKINNRMLYKKPALTQ